MLDQHPIDSSNNMNESVCIESVVERTEVDLLIKSDLFT